MNLKLHANTNNAETWQRSTTPIPLTGYRKPREVEAASCLIARSADGRYSVLLREKSHVARCRTPGRVRIRGMGVTSWTWMLISSMQSSQIKQRQFQDRSSLHDVGREWSKTPCAVIISKPAAYLAWMDPFGDRSVLVGT